MALKLNFLTSNKERFGFHWRAIQVQVQLRVNVSRNYVT